MPEFKQLPLYDEILEFSKQSAALNLLESGVDVNFFKPMMDKMNSAVFDGSNYDDLIDDLGDFVKGSDGSVGGLKRYVSQVSNDSLTQFNATYNQTITNDLGMEWYKYTGTKIADTRPFCIHYMKDYLHKKEVEQLGMGVDPISKKSLASMSLLAGRIKGTNKSNIFINRGGWNCRHYFSPLSSRLVPKKDIIRNIKNGNYKPSKGDKKRLGNIGVDDVIEVPNIPTPKVVKPTSFIPSKSLSEATERIKKLGVKEVELKGLKINQANAVLKSMEQQSKFGKLDLDRLRTYRNSKSTFLGVYSPSNNSIGLNLSSIKKMRVEGKIVPFEDKITSLQSSIASINRQIPLFEKAIQNPKNKKTLRGMKSRLLRYERDIEALNKRIDNGDSPKFWSVGSSQKTVDEYLGNTVTHEMGHYRDYQQLRGTEKEFKFNFNPKNSVSEYGATNREEYFAEAFAAFFNGDKSAIPKDLLKIFEEWK